LLGATDRSPGAPVRQIQAAHQHEGLRRRLEVSEGDPTGGWAKVPRRPTVHRGAASLSMMDSNSIFVSAFNILSLQVLRCRWAAIHRNRLVLAFRFELIVHQSTESFVSGNIAFMIQPLSIFLSDVIY
jgi:hypothetical protein